MSNPKIELKSDGERSVVFINDVEVCPVWRWELVHEAGSIPALVIHIHALNVTIDGEAVDWRKDI